MLATSREDLLEAPFLARTLFQSALILIVVAGIAAASAGYVLLGPRSANAAPATGWRFPSHPPDCQTTAGNAPEKQHAW